MPTPDPQIFPDAPGETAVVWMDAVDSTNGRLAAAARAEPDRWRGRVLAAHHQTAGRGRRGRTWHSAPGVNLTCSLCHPAPRPRREWPTLTQTTALAVCAYLRTLGIDGVCVKWPNDVRVRDRKICGILAEPAPPAGLVIGLGLNVNMTAEAARAIDQPATSLHLETGRTFAVEAVLDELLPILRAHLARWDRDGFEAVRDTYLDAAGGCGARMCIRDDHRIVEGCLAGIAVDGALELRLDDGSLRTVYSGDLHLPPATARGPGCRRADSSRPPECRRTTSSPGPG
jgi:BirA family transcriptional regulator, biotin operon repressor / biotin---[acetyl-CoA-carboxylase] ligase